MKKILLTALFALCLPLGAQTFASPPVMPGAGAPPGGTCPNDAVYIVNGVWAICQSGSWVLQNALPSIGTENLLANLTGGSAAPLGHTLSAILDSVFGTTIGELVCRASGGWSAFTPPVSNNIPLVSQVANCPIYAAINLAGGSSYTIGISPVPNGGSGAGTFAAHGILIGETTAAFNVLSPSGDSVPLWQSAGADPVASSLPNCANDGSHAVVYSTSTHTFACASITTGIATFESGGAGGVSSATANFLNGGCVAATIANVSGAATITLANDGTCQTVLGGIAGTGGGATAISATGGATGTLVAALPVFTGGTFQNGMSFMVTVTDANVAASATLAVQSVGPAPLYYLSGGVATAITSTCIYRNQPTLLMYSASGGIGGAAGFKVQCN